MTNLLFKTASAVFVSVFLLALGGCETGTNQNYDTYGDTLSGAEVTQVLSGSFLPFRDSRSGTYFAPDGKISSLRGGGAIGIGTWVAGDRGLCIEEAVFYRENGQVKAEPAFRTCYFVFGGDDGSYIWDPVGSGRNIVLRPGSLVRGFPGQAEFNALRRDLGV